MDGVLAGMGSRWDGVSLGWNMGPTFYSRGSNVSEVGGARGRGSALRCLWAKFDKDSRRILWAIFCWDGEKLG